MSISFTCPFCKKPYKVKDELAGKRAPCNGCKKVMTIPRLSPTLSAEESAAVEALASAALSEVPAPAAEVATGDEVPLECPFCFEKVSFPRDKAGKQAPCPQCRRLIKVPVPSSNKPRENWRAAEHNFTMARKVDQVNPDGAWGNAALNQAVVSREALLEAEVILDRKAMAAPDRTKTLIVTGVLLFACIVGGWWYWRGRAADERRHGLIADAVKAADPKKSTLPPGWAAVIHLGAGEFWLNESSPDLKQATTQFRIARDAAGKIENPTDRAAVLTAIAVAQAGLVGADDDAVKANKALPWEDAQNELRRTLQRFHDVPRENAWWVVEELARKLQSKGEKSPMIATLAPAAFPAESDRAEALACVALALKPINSSLADDIAKDARAALLPETPPSMRVVTLLVAQKEMALAQQIMPEAKPPAEPTQSTRLAYANGYARTGDAADLPRGRAIVTAGGPVDEAAMAYAVFAAAAAEFGHPEELDAAVPYILDTAQKFTLPPWTLERLAVACSNAQKREYLKQLAEVGKQPLAKPWLELAALRSDLAAPMVPGDPDAPKKMVDKSLAQAMAWMATARQRTRINGGDARVEIDGWADENARPLGYVGAALGMQDRAR